MEPQLEILARWFREAAEIASKHGIRLAVENHIDYNSDEILWLIEQVGSEYFGINLDTANFLRVLDDPVEAARSWRATFMPHTSGPAARREWACAKWYYFSCVAAGEGLIEIDKIAQVLKDSGYQGFLAFETDMPHPDYAEREEEMVERSIRHLKSVTANLK
jgi:sugar phosphate isomerase/epimerase